MSLESSSPWVTVPRPRQQGVRLFCLPYAGAGASAFRGWADLLPSVEVANVHLPGRESRIGESPVVDLDALVASVAEHTDRPYALFGHSFGARLAFELCRRLRERDAPAPLWLFISGCQAPQLPPLRPPASRLDDRGLIARLSELGGTPPEVFTDPELWAMALPVLRADLAYVDDYAYRSEPPFNCPITVFAGTADNETRHDDLFAWEEHTTSSFAVRVLPGDHFFLHSARRQLLASIGADLATGPVLPTRISVPVLEPGEVHVWNARIDELPLCDSALRTGLAAEELDRADAFHFRHDAVRFVRRRWLLRRLLAAYGADPGTSPLATGPHGKPRAAPGADVTFSASSSAGLVMVAVARDGEIGLDVEHLRPVADFDLLAGSTMAAHELAELDAIPTDRREAAFLRRWTLKEAVLKGLGVGLSLDPAEVLTRSIGGDRWEVAVANEAGPNAWSAAAVEAGGGEVAALAVPGRTLPRIRRLELTIGRLS